MKNSYNSTSHILPDRSVIIVGGRKVATVEYFPLREGGTIFFSFLVDARDKQMDNMYPYVHLLPDGHLFVFANDSAVSFDYELAWVVRQYPPLEGGPCNYPSTGLSVMLALEGGYNTTMIVVCGGASYGTFILRNKDSPAPSSCDWIVATAVKLSWELENMLFGRIMGNVVMLPTGEVLIVNDVIKM